MAAALLAASLDAAVIRGVVVEQASGRPLAWALIELQPVAGTQSAPQYARCDRGGQFEFRTLPAGAYLVRASRWGFAPMEYGQKHWKGTGVPLVLEESGSAAIDIRLQHFGAIAGTVVDENEVGLPDHEVVAYRNGQPPILAGRARTDDLGRYRLGGLEPGSYVVRTVGEEYDEGSYLPTFSWQATRLEEAKPIDVGLDQEIGDIDVRPFRGRLFAVAGIAAPSATVTLISDMGRQAVRCDEHGRFKFPPAAPGAYELYATSEGGGAITAGYEAILVDRDRSDYRIRLAPLPDVVVKVEDSTGQPVDAGKAEVLIRRKDLAGNGPQQTLRTPQALAPGAWEFSLAPNPDSYGLDGWKESMVAGSGPVEVKLRVSSDPARLHGTVQDGGKPVAGAPVYLEMAGSEPRMTRADTGGRYEFYGLAPGEYRLLSSFDGPSADAAQAVKVEAGQEQTVDLPLYGER